MENIITEAMSIIYENRHKGNFTLWMQTNVASIDFTHFNDVNKSVKNIRSYFDGALSTSKGDYYVPIKSFIPELKKYVESL